MNLTLRLLGFEVLHLSTDALEFEAEDDEGASLDGGTTASYPLGFSVSQPPPYEHDCPPHIEWPE